MVLAKNDVNYAIFCTTGKEQDSPSRNSQYPAWETFDELREIKFSNELGPRCIAVDIIFGNKKYWAKWLLSATEAMFDFTFYPQYDQNENFFSLEDQLKGLWNSWKREALNEFFYKYIQDELKGAKSDLDIKKAYDNLCNFFEELHKFKESELEYFWLSVSKYYSGKTKNALSLLEEQLREYSSPSSRPSIRYAVLLNAISSGLEKAILKYLFSSGPCKLDDLVNALSLSREDVVSSIEFLLTLKLIKRTRDSGIAIGKKNIVSSLFFDFSKLGLTEEMIERAITSILRDRKRELIDNFDIIRNWEVYKSQIKTLLLGKFEDNLLEHWNDKHERQIWRKIILDVFGLKESDMRPVISTDKFEVGFYTRDFSKNEITSLTNALKGKKDLLLSNIPLESLLLSFKRKIGERVWQEMNNPKVSPIDYIIAMIIEDFHPTKARVATLFKELVRFRRKYLQTYPIHGDGLSGSQGIVAYPWCIEVNNKLILLKSRFAQKSTVQHRCPEEAGRSFGAVVDVGLVSRQIQPMFKDNYSIFFLPDGYWREEDLWHLAKSGIHVFLNLNDLRNYIKTST